MARSHRVPRKASGPDRAAALRQARAAYERGAFQEAARIGEGLLKSDPRDIDALRLLAAAALTRDRYTEAARYVKRGLKVAPDDPTLLARKGFIEHQNQNHDEAMQSFSRALEKEPALAVALYGKAGLLELRGEREAAIELLRPHISGAKSDPQLVALYVDLLGKEGLTDEAAAAVKARLDDERVPALVQRELQFALGRALERAGKIDDAFAVFERGNRLLEGVFQRDAYRSQHDQIIETFSADAMKQFPRSRNLSRRPILIVGMPRCGSTLVEQIFGAHPEVAAGGELHFLSDMVTAMPQRLGSGRSFPQCMERFGERHVAAMAGEYLGGLRTIDRRAARVTDKMLFNYAFLGLISLLLPQAQVIHCRRNPLDITLSCYPNLSPRVHPWVTSFRDIAFAYRQYERLMDHWERTLDFPILAIDYEKLVTDTEPVTRGMISFCGLEWDDACLEFHKSERVISTFSYDQASRPIYTSSLARFRKYESVLEPARRAFAEEGIEIRNRDIPPSSS